MDHKRYADDIAPQRKVERRRKSEARRLEAKAQKSEDIKFVKEKTKCIVHLKSTGLRQKLKK